ncbi:MAG: adenine deaminase [Actinobacteria bacterium]|nr:adenine deaminase [Actinomycetota bacterium]
MNLEEIIAVGRGLKPADLVIRNARLVDVLSSNIVATDVAVHAGWVAGLGSYDGETVIDLEGRYLCTGFIDAHLHIESTMLTPPEFARAVVGHGTTAVVCDPHEIANVLGIEGINYMLRASAGLPVTVYVMLPSCVPATTMETSGAQLTSRDLSLLLTQNRVLGIAEMMNYPGVLAGDPDVLDKIRIADGRRVDGHAPGLTGKDLCAYIDAGIHSDHECVTAAEAKEKLGLGMYIMAREGSTARNLQEIVSIITSENSRRFMHCTDDRHPGDLLGAGHIDHNIRRAIAAGVAPLIAIQMATINPAAYFGLKDTGAVAPGFKADFAVLDDLETVTVSKVFKAGQVVAQDGAATAFKSESPGRIIRSTVNIRKSGTEQLRIKAAGQRLKVIGVVPDQIITNKLVLGAAIDDAGFAVSDPGRDILKIAVFERHLASGNVGLGFVQGMGLKQGAIATSVAHDSHNVIVVGASDDDMWAAVREIIRMQGGAAVVAGGEVLASLPLPVAGLMSDRPAAEVAAGSQAVIEAAWGLGCQLPDPLITLSFLALPVIPQLKLTDRGLVDVEQFELVGLWE